MILRQISPSMVVLQIVAPSDNIFLLKSSTGGYSSRSISVTLQFLGFDCNIREMEEVLKNGCQIREHLNEELRLAKKDVEIIKI